MSSKIELGYELTGCLSQCRQSPINITRDLVETCAEPLNFNNDYCQKARRIDMYSDGHSIVLKFLGIEPEVMSGPLPDIYKLHSIHFHWSTDDYSGSEHTLTGFAYPMEMHVVHTKQGVDLPTAQKDPSGIAVIGYWFEIGPMEYTNAIRCITESLKYLTKDTPKATLTNIFTLSDLVVPFHDRYVTYKGSLTTPPYSEAVIWIMSPYSIKITPFEMNEFRKLSARGVVESHENFRDTQPLYGRTVKYNIVCKYPNGISGCSSLNPFRFENIFSDLLGSI